MFRWWYALFGNKKKQEPIRVYHTQQRNNIHRNYENIKQGNLVGGSREINTYQGISDDLLNPLSPFNVLQNDNGIPPGIDDSFFGGGSSCDYGNDGSSSESPASDIGSCDSSCGSSD